MFTGSGKVNETPGSGQVGDGQVKGDDFIFPFTGAMDIDKVEHQTVFLWFAQKKGRDRRCPHSGFR